MAEKEYIERDMMYKFIELFNTQYSDNRVLTKASFQHLIDIFPSADVAPVKHGHWINENFYTRCSVCGNMAIYDKYGQEVESDYCPRCGAKLC